MSNIIKYHNPNTSIKSIDVGVHGGDYIKTFKTTTSLFTPSSKIIIYNPSGVKIKDYIVGDGLVITGSGVLGEEQTLTWDFTDFDFKKYAGKDLRVVCILFEEGRSSIETKFNVIW